MSVRTKLRGNWLITVPLVGLTIGYIGLFDTPARRAAKNLRLELDASQAQAAQGPLIMKQIAEAQSELARTKAFVADWCESSATQGGSAAMLGEISRLSRRAGTRTTRLEPGSSPDHEELYSLALTLVSLGSFEEVFELLRGIESLPQAVWIEELRIGRKPGNEEELQCELKLAVFAGKPEISD
jgi:Tfp pilus assembly protein PilO